MLITLYLSYIHALYVHMYNLLTYTLIYCIYTVVGLKWTPNPKSAEFQYQDPTGQWTTSINIHTSIFHCDNT